MIKLKLYRFTQDHAIPTRGILECDGEKIGYTGELPWKENEKNISCIPTDVYTCKRINKTNKITVQGVPERTNIQIHSGNFTSDIKGCILVGLKIGSGKFLVRQSKLAMKKLIKLIGNETAILTITLADIKKVDSGQKLNWREARKEEKASYKTQDINNVAEFYWYDYIKLKRIIPGFIAIIFGLVQNNSEWITVGSAEVVGGIGTKAITNSKPEVNGDVGKIYHLVDSLFTFWQKKKNKKEEN